MHACDGRTDGQTEFSSLDGVCIPCSAVKIDRAHMRSMKQSLSFNWQWLYSFCYDTRCWQLVEPSPSCWILRRCRWRQLLLDAIDAYVGWQEAVHLLHVSTHSPSAAESLGVSLSRAVVITSAILIAVSGVNLCATSPYSTVNYPLSCNAEFYVSCLWFR